MKRFFVLGAVALAASAAAQIQTPTQVETSHTPEGLPWGEGERHVFDVKFGPVRVGTSTMEVGGVTQIRGRPAYETRFTLRGGTFFYRVNDVLHSWVDTATLASLRFVQDLEEGSRERERRFEIYPERRVYIETTATNPTELPSVDLPLDDGSFLYFIRTVSLRVGTNLELHRYFRPDRNPVRVRVVRRERITVPAGTFDAVVLRPTIKTKGIFAEGGHAEVWIADDPRRMILQVKSRLSFGTLSLHLRSYTPPTAMR